MSDNMKDSNPDNDLINMHEQWQVIYWAKKWSITEEQLKRAWKHAQSSSAKKIHDAAVFLQYMTAKF